MKFCIPSIISMLLFFLRIRQTIALGPERRLQFDNSETIKLYKDSSLRRREIDILNNRPKNETFCSFSSVYQSKNIPRCDTAQQSSLEVEIAIAFDSTFCAAFGSFSHAVTMVKQLIRQVSSAFEPACIKLSLVHLTGYCTTSEDPYIDARGSPNDILSSFSRKWVSVNTASELPEIDVVYLLSGFSTTSGMGNAVPRGITTTGGACSGTDRFGWVERANAISLAHELGHSLSCRHVSEGLMQPQVNVDGSFKFSKDSLNTIKSFVTSDTGKSCITKPKELRPQGLPTAATSCMDAKKSQKQLKSGRGQFNIGVAPRTFKIKIRQRENLLKISFKTMNSKITALAFRASTTPSLTQYEVGEWKRYGKGKKQLKLKIDYNDLDVPAGKESCCNETIYLYLGIIWCDANNLKQCSRAIGNKQYTIKCKK